MPGSGLPPPGWEDDILSALGAPESHSNVSFLDDWAAAEHGSGTRSWGGQNEGGAYNPFDTTLGANAAAQPWSTGESVGPPFPGTIYNSVGVMDYADWPVGQQATVQTLKQQNMSPLTSALRSGKDSVSELESAEGQTPWGREPSWPSGSKVPTSNIPPISSMKGFGSLPAKQKQLLEEIAAGLMNNNTSHSPPLNDLSPAALAIFNKWYGKFYTSIGGGKDSGAAKPTSLVGTLGDIANYLTGGGLFAPFSNLFKILAWITQPKSWLRIFCGFAGLVFAIGGGVALAGVR